MSDTEQKRQRLLANLSRSVAYTAPLLVAVTGAASLHAIVADVRDATPTMDKATLPRDGTPAPAPEATPEGMPEAAPEAAPEAVPEAAPEAAPEASPEAMPEAAPEAMPEATPEAMPEAAQ